MTILLAITMMVTRCGADDSLVLDGELRNEIEACGFEQSRNTLRGDKRPIEAELSFTHRRDHSPMTMWVSERQKDFQFEEIYQMIASNISNARIKPNPNSITGMPLGDFCFSSVHAASFRVSGYAGKFGAGCQINYFYRNDPSSPTLLQEDAPRDRALGEGAVRKCLAQALGLDLVPAQPKPVNGKLCSDVLKTPGGMVVANVDEVCSALGVSLTKNPRLGSMTFQHDDRAIILALGADKVKVGASWKALGWFVARRGEKWYVPLDGLTSALGE